MFYTVEESLKCAHEELWKRFIYKPYGIILDYTDKNGDTHIPSPEECIRLVPNGLSWWTPIENGAFFTGLYLSCLIELWKTNKNDKIKEEISRLIKGLFLLEDVGNTDGFIARGVSSDGKSHYPIGSEDQTAPFIYGLWQVLKSDYPSTSLKNEIKERLLRVINALFKKNFRVPTEWEGVSRGNFCENNFAAAARLLFICRIAAEISDDKVWIQRYAKLSNERPSGSIRTRLEMCGDGFAVDMVQNPGLNGQFWIFLGAQAALSELCSLESDKKITAYYERGLYLNAVATLNALDNYKKYSNEDNTKFDCNWKGLEKFWRSHNSIDEAVDIAMKQHAYWSENIVPKRTIEHNVLTQMFYAAWIAKLSNKKEIYDYADGKLHSALMYIDWKTLNLPVAFVAECAAYQPFGREK